MDKDFSGGGVGRLVALFAFGLIAFLSQAQSRHPLAVHGFTEVGHNTTMQFYGGVGTIVHASLTNYFTLSGGAYFPLYKDFIVRDKLMCNPAAFIKGKIQFPLKHGYTLFLENRYLVRALNAYRVYELNGCLSLGCESPRFVCCLGMANRLIAGYEYDPADGSRFVSEPFNLLYSLEAYLFRRTARKWNVGLRFSNYRLFRINHCSDPDYALLGAYSVSSRLNLLMDVGVRPAGVFNLTAHYYESYFNMGVKYKW